MENSEKVKISEQVRIYRAKHRLSQTEFGLIIGVSQRILSFLETESWKFISNRTMQKIKDAVENLIAKDK